jgi:hypothetical protein
MGTSRLATEWAELVVHSFTRASSLPLAINFVSIRLKSTDLSQGPDYRVPTVLRIRVPLPFWPLIRDGYKIRIRIRDNNPDHISESLETIFCIKILKFFYADPWSGIRDGKNSDPGWKNFGTEIEYITRYLSYCLRKLQGHNWQWTIACSHRSV